MYWLSRIFHVGFGVLIGVGLLWSWSFQKPNPVDYPLEIDHKFNYDQAKNEIDISKTVVQAVREEMTAQLALFKLNSQQDCLKIAVDKDEQNNYNSNTEKHDVIYSAANHKLDEVISSGGFDAASAKEFLDQLSALPPDKAFELRLKHVQAINDGSISSPITPEQALIVK